MAIVSGYQKMKDYIKQSSGYKLLSRWANANTVECDDAQTVQSKIGGITGISSSLTANSSTQAASTNLTNQLYQNINIINTYVDEEGRLHFVNGSGADTVIPFNNLLSNVLIVGESSASRAQNALLINSDNININSGILIIGFSAYYMRGETSNWGKITITGADSILLQKQWIVTGLAGHAVFIYKITNVQNTISISSTNESNSNSSLTAMVLY